MEICLISQLVESIDLEQESFLVYTDFCFLPAFLLFFLTVRFLLDRFLFEKLGERLIIGKGDLAMRRSDSGASHCQCHPGCAFNILRVGRVGSVILALHDASDIFLEIGKMCICIGADSTSPYLLSVLDSMEYKILELEKLKINGPVYYYVFNTLLYCLLVLHIYWSVLIWRMLVEQIRARGRLNNDVRSDSESSE